MSMKKKTALFLAAALAVSALAGLMRGKEENWTEAFCKV